VGKRGVYVGISASVLPGASVERLYLTWNQRFY